MVSTSRHGNDLNDHARQFAGAGGARRSRGDRRSSATTGATAKAPAVCLLHVVCGKRFYFRMDIARIAELLQPFLGTAAEQRLTNNDLEHISTYIDLLLRWNARINLTAVRDPEQIVTRHFGEAFFAVRHLFPSRSSVSSVASPVVNAFELADLGSGAGFPGLPFKLWVSQISLTLIESNHKKAAFLREVTRALTLTNVNVRVVRAEDLSGMSFDLITLRAVERFTKVLPIATKLLAPAGRLALLIGSVQLQSARDAVPRLTWSDPIPIPLSSKRVLVVGQPMPSTSISPGMNQTS